MFKKTWFFLLLTFLAAPRIDAGQLSWNVSADKNSQFQNGPAGLETSRGVTLNQQFPRVALRPDVRINPVDPNYWIAQNGKPGGYGFFPVIVRAKDGTLVAGWLEPAHMPIENVGRAAYSYSIDGGKTWSKPADLVNNSERAELGGMFTLSDGTVLATAGQGKTGSVFSVDNGRTWQKPVPDSRLFFPGNGGRNIVKIERPDGTLISARTSGGRIISWRIKTGTGWETKTFSSKNLGMSEEWDIMDTDPNGGLVALMRNAESEYFMTSFSRDWGQTWDKATPSIWIGSVGVQPRLSKLRDGTIVCSYAERANARTMLIPSFDGGKTWDNSHKMVIVDSHGRFGDFGYTGMAWVEGDKYLAVSYDDGAILGTFIDSRFFRDVYDGVRLASNDAVRDFTVGQWSFNEDDPKIVYDSTGKNYGKIIGGANRVPGKFGQALEFNGESAYVFVNDSDTLRVPRFHALECWIKPQVVDREQVILSKAPAYEFGLTKEGKMFYQSGSVRFTGATPLKIGEWQHICVVLSQTYESLCPINFYLNGKTDGGSQERSSFSASDYTEAYLRSDMKITQGPMYQTVYNNAYTRVGPTHFLNHLYIGRSRGPETRYFSGLIDEVAIQRGMGDTIDLADEFREPTDFITTLNRAYVPVGEIVSEPIKLPNGRKWGALETAMDIPEGTAIHFDVLDAEGKPVRENVKDGDDLSGLKNTEIRLRAKLSTANTAVTPVLHSAKVVVK